ncbi:MAG: cold shock domain-containing protein [Bacilli bacterium]
MNKGRVKWFNNEKGYGFIEYGEVLDEDIFVHFSAIKEDGYKTLKEGDIVSFELIKTDKGAQAINVKEVKLTTV